MIDKTDAAYLLGVSNRRNGCTVNENPFHEENQAHGLWNAGYLAEEAAPRPEKFNTDFGFGQRIEATSWDGKISVVTICRSETSFDDDITNITADKAAWRAFARWLLDPDGDPFAEEPK